MYPEGNILKPSGKDLLKHSQDTTLSLQHRDLLIYILVEDLLHNIKRHTEDDIVGWVVGQPLDIFQFTIQTLRN